MYTPSERFLNFIQTNTTRTARSKIVVDGVTYTGHDTLKTAPQLIADAEFYGSFPAKTCTFELFNTAKLQLAGKEVSVFRGLDIDGVTEWVPLGIFIAPQTDLKTSQSGNTITFTGYDRAIYFDIEYEPVEVSYPITIGAWVQEIAQRRGVGFSSTPFPCCDILLASAPNIPEGTTEREIIRQIAELGGANAYIDRNGDLCISQPVATGKRISRRMYQSLSSREEPFGGINAVVVINDAPEPAEGEEVAEDAPETITYTYQDTEAIAAANGIVTALTLTNNIFAGADQEGFAHYIGDSYIFGLSYIPFEVVGVVDDWLLDIGDLVTVEDVDGTTFETVILAYQNTDRIKATIAAPVMDDVLADYSIEGTVQKTQTYVGIKIDALTQSIESKVSVNGVISAINQSAEKIAINANRINLTGLITAESLGPNGTTVIDGGRINTQSLNIGGWAINDDGLYYGEAASPDLYLGTAGKRVTVGGVARDDIVFKAGDSFAVCADGCLYASEGEFGGDLTGDTVLFNNLQARSGGKITIGDIEFTAVDNIAKIGSVSPMQIGAFSGGIVNEMELYGTAITFHVSKSDYTAIMDIDGNREEICFRPTITNTGNIGTANYVWDTGHFRNITVYNYVTAQNVKANSNITAETFNAGSGRVSGTMVIGDATAAQPSKGLKIANIATATNTSAYASDKVMTIGDSGTLYKTGVTLSQLYAAAGSSSRRYKNKIAPLGADYDIFDLLQPIQFNYKNSGEKGLGLLAEDLAAIAPDLCYYDDTGAVEGVKYQSIIALLIREIQKLKGVVTVGSEAS